VLLRFLRLALLLCMPAACGDGRRPPAPTFRLLFPPVTGTLMTSSSPGLADLTGDGVPDIVFGTGVDRIAPGGERFGYRAEPEVAGRVVAVSGASNEVLWSVPNPNDAFTTPRFLELSGDGVPDVVMGGREGRLTAFSGTDGTVLWRTSGQSVAATDFPYNFFTPALIRDANGDGTPDLVVLYGGDDRAPPSTPRSTGYVAAISGVNGGVLAVHETPDGAETYSSAVVYERADGTEWLIFGTGGETQPGAAYRAPVASLLDGTFADRAERLVEPGSKGVIAPAVVVELTGDAESDIVVSTFDGRLVAVDGATAQPLWEQHGEGEETYHPPAVLRRTRDGRLAFFVSRGIGVFPRYDGSIQRLVDATNGRVLVDYENALAPGGAPLAVDLTGNGVDEAIFFSIRFPGEQSSRLHVLHFATGKLITYDLPTIFATTPVIADPRSTGSLEMIGLAWQLSGDSMPTAGAADSPPAAAPGSDAAAPADSNAMPWRSMRWQLLRLDLTAATPQFRSWAGYMGTGTDGRFRRPE
jgi:outer membrane protein assembly factor BamB